MMHVRRMRMRRVRMRRVSMRVVRMRRVRMRVVAVRRVRVHRLRLRLRVWTVTMRRWHLPPDAVGHAQRQQHRATAQHDSRTVPTSAPSTFHAVTSTPSPESSNRKWQVHGKSTRKRQVTNRRNSPRGQHSPARQDRPNRRDGTRRSPHNAHRPLVPPTRMDPSNSLCPRWLTPHSLLTCL